MKHESNMTSKGQVTVPKDIRDALGLTAGNPVRFEIDGDGNARIMKADDAFAVERRKSHFLQRLEKARAKFKAMDTMPGMDGLEYQRWMRGDGPEV
jgi:AbrB family looped-hinge helix DNA binding protein